MNSGFRNAAVGSFFIAAGALVWPAAGTAGQRTGSEPPSLPTSAALKQQADSHQAGRACKPGVPLEASLDFAAPPRVGQPARLVLSVLAKQELKRPEVRWDLPEGAYGLSAPESPAGPLPADRPARFGAALVFTRPGEYQLSALVLEKGEHAQWGRQASLWVRLDGAGAAYVSRSPFPVPAAVRTGAPAFPVAPPAVPVDAYAKAGPRTAPKAPPKPARREFYSDTPPNSSYARVRGYLRYRHNDGNMRGINGATVEVWDTDGWTGGGHDRLTTLTTTNEGYFHSDWFFNRDEEWFGNRQDIQLVFVAESGYARVVNPSHGGPFKVLYQGPQDLPDGDNFFGNIDMDFDGPGTYPDDGVEGAYEILDTLNIGGRFFHWRNRELPRVDAYWQPGSTTRAQYDGATWRIYLADGDQFDPAVILHEFGHHVMDFYRGGLPAGADDTYPWFSQGTPAWAWSEGWATYVSCMLRNDHWYQDRAGVGDSTTMYESLEYDPGYASPGDSYGGAVAGALWDLYDSLADDPNPRDQHAFPESDIFATLTQMPANNSVWDFRQTWLQQGRGTGIDPVFQDHNILQNSPVYVVVDVPNRTGKVGATVRFNTTLRRTTDDGPIRWWPLTYKINGQVFATASTDDNGQCAPAFTIPTSYWEGQYQITVEFLGSWRYYSATSYSYLTVTREATSITSSAVSGRVGETVNLTSVLKRSADAQPLADRTVYFHVAGETAGTAQTNASGEASLAYTIPASIGRGEKALHATFYGDSLHGQASVQTTLTVREDARLAVVNATGGIGQTVPLRAKLTRPSDGAALAGKTVSFRIDGEPVGSAVSNSNGLAELRYRLPEALALGTRALSASFDGDTEYGAGSAEGTLAVAVGKTSVAVPALKGKIGQSVYLVGTLRRPLDAAPLPGRTLAFSVNGTSVGTSVTDTKGTARLKYAIPEALGVGVKTVKVDFAGDDKHAASTRSGSLTVAVATTRVIVSPRSGKAGQTVQLTAVLKRATDGAPLPGRTVTFKVNGVAVGSAVTTDKGIAQRAYVIPGNIGTGAKPIQASFAGDAAHAASAGSSTLTINP